METSIKKRFINKKVKVSNKRYSNVVIEKGDIFWSKEDARKREKIIKTVGLEYKQINLIAKALYVIVEKDDELKNNPIIQEAMKKFEEINRIRNDK